MKHKVVVRFDWEQFKEVAGIFYGFGKKDHSDTLESEKPFKEPIDGVLYAVACGIKNKGQIEKPEKPLRADLEEASDEYAEKHGFRVPYDGSDNFYDDVDVKASKEGFIAGAKWMAEHLKK